MNKNNKSKIWAVLTFVSLTVFLSLPFFDIYILKPVSFDQQIDAELMTGLLTASSILFAFSTILITPLIEKKKHQKTLVVILLFPLATTILAGVSIYEVSLGRLSGVETMLRLYTNFNVNIVSTMFIVIIRWIYMENNKGEKNND